MKSSEPVLAPTKERARRLGAYSVTGPVRDTNQDRVHVGPIGTVDVIVIADGLGGLPRGGEAAEVAVAHAVARLRRELTTAMEANIEGVRTLFLSILWSAANRIARDAAAEGRVAAEDGFRTTLVLVAVVPDAYVTAWVGDGGVFVARANDDIVALLEPHKSPETPNLLEASLGPTTEGRPSWAIAPRLPGDVLIAATDGIADEFGPNLLATVRTHLRASGSVEQAARLVVEELATDQDDTGAPFIADNLTLALHREVV